jgi:hypothetical protein
MAGRVNAGDAMELGKCRKTNIRAVNFGLFDAADVPTSAIVHRDDAVSGL